MLSIYLCTTKLSFKLKMWNLTFEDFIAKHCGENIYDMILFSFSIFYLDVKKAVKWSMEKLNLKRNNNASLIVIQPTPYGPPAIREYVKGELQRRYRVKRPDMQRVKSSEDILKEPADC